MPAWGFYHLSPTHGMHVALGASAEGRDTATVDMITVGTYIVSPLPPGHFPQ